VRARGRRKEAAAGASRSVLEEWPLILVWKREQEEEGDGPVGRRRPYSYMLSKVGMEMVRQKTARDGDGDGDDEEAESR
jgi:hypothetical protein